MYELHVTENHPLRLDMAGLMEPVLLPQLGPRNNSINYWNGSYWRTSFSENI